MVRVSPTAAVLSLAFVLTAGLPAQAADLHWFYDREQTRQNGEYYDNYEQASPSYEQANPSVYRPKPEYSVYQPALRPARRQLPRYGDEAVSCLQGVELLRDYGFRHIEVVDCRNGHYVYEAVRGREPWRIQLSRASGELVNAEPLN